jgi:hypothetical protein
MWLIESVPILTNFNISSLYAWMGLFFSVVSSLVIKTHSPNFFLQSKHNDGSGHYKDFHSLLFLFLFLIS